MALVRTNIVDNVGMQHTKHDMKSRGREKYKVRHMVVSTSLTTKEDTAISFPKNNSTHKTYPVSPRMISFNSRLFFSPDIFLLFIFRSLDSIKISKGC